MRAFARALTLFTLVAPASLIARDARACGGCFHPPPQPAEQESVITDHRMAFAMGPTQTILWDQVRYSGDPQEFAWVLPVHEGARIEAAQDAFLAALAALTTPTVSPPQTFCGGGSSRSSGFGCGSSSTSAEAMPAAGGGTFAGNGQVTVVSESVVGPYETVTLRSTSGDALDQWLAANGFDLPASVAPVVAAYVREGFDFIALKLRPGQGVRAMQPVRVVTPGADPTLPLRMVAAGVGANVGLELYVISEGRYHTANFPDATIDLTRLTWDPKAEESNYSTLAASAMAVDQGRGWLTEFAGPAPLTGTIAASSVSATLDQLYASTCTPAPPYAAPCDAGSPDASDEDASDASDASGASPEDASCATTITERCDDVDAALAGLHPADVWITRLRAMLPASALAADLLLEAAPHQVAVQKDLVAASFTDPNYSPCGNGANGSSGGDCACRTVPEPDRFGLGCVAGAAILAVATHLRRRARHRRS